MVGCWDFKPFADLSKCVLNELKYTIENDNLYIEGNLLGNIYDLHKKGVEIKEVNGVITATSEIDTIIET